MFPGLGVLLSDGTFSFARMDEHDFYGTYVLITGGDLVIDIR